MRTPNVTGMVWLTSTRATASDRPARAAGRFGAHAKRWTLAGVAGLLAGFLAFPANANAAPVPTQLNATDMALLSGVRLAGLWEMPAGQMAAEKGNQQRVREIGAEISRQHVRLDELVVEAANKLGAEIPEEPTAEQKKWLSEMQNASGERFDQIFVDRLRIAHGKIFPVIGAIRAGTRNPVIRKLAQDANTFVNNHMSMLESTGLVRYTELPPAAVPAPQDDSTLAIARANVGPGLGFNPMVIWIVLLGALVAGGFSVIRLVGWRR